MSRTPCCYGEDPYCTVCAIIRDGLGPVDRDPWMVAFLADIRERFAPPPPNPAHIIGDPEPLPEEIHDRFEPYESIYELTLTTPDDDPYELRSALERIVKSAMFEVKGYIACLELTVKGIPHIHALLFSNRKYIDGSKIKALYTYRYECKRVRRPADYYEYLQKEDGNPLVEDYCVKKGIPQLWSWPPE